MAVKYSDIKEKVGEPTLSDKELAAIASVEQYIDGIINRDFDNTVLCFDLSKINFTHPVDRGGDVNFKDTRKKLMFKELERRYTEAGWTISYDYDSIIYGWRLSGK